MGPTWGPSLPRSVVFHSTVSLAQLVAPPRPRSSNRQHQRVDGQRSHVAFCSVCSRTPSQMLRSRVSMLTLWSLITSRLTPPPSNVDVPTVPTVASTPTWPPHVTLRLFSLSVRSPCRRVLRTQESEPKEAQEAAHDGRSICRLRINCSLSFLFGQKKKKLIRFSTVEDWPSKLYTCLTSTTAS